MSLKGRADWALSLIRTLPRVSLSNIKGDLPRKKTKVHGQHGGGKRHGYQQKGAKQRLSFSRLGYEGGTFPFYLRIPCEPYYKGHHLRRQYPPISLLQIQKLIDTNRLNSNLPIDMTAICNTKIFPIEPQLKHFGFQLTEEGMDDFTARVNIEVQWTTEPVIAAIEKNGGMITTAYYDKDSLWAAVDPVKFFLKGVPIPKRMLPPEDAIEYYSDPKFRGYLSDPDKIAEERLVLAQKYGYQLPDINKDPQREMLLMRKDPRQIFFGLKPGWVVNLKNKCILKPTRDTLKEYYYT